MEAFTQNYCILSTASMHLSLPAALLLLNTFAPLISSSIIPITDPPQPSVTSFPPSATQEARIHRLFNLSSNNGFENLAFRSNGHLLATTAFPSALLWYIDPSSIASPLLLKNFTMLDATLGITELAHDMFYVVGSGANVSSNIYSVDMRPFTTCPNGTALAPPVIKEIGSIPFALALNGMTYIHRSDKFVLIADTLLGGVWKFDVETGKSDLIIQDSSMEGPKNKTAFAAFGINGLRTQNQTLFYTNSGAQTMYRMPVS